MESKESNQELTSEKSVTRGVESLWDFSFLPPQEEMEKIAERAKTIQLAKDAKRAKVDALVLALKDCQGVVYANRWQESISVTVENEEVLKRLTRDLVRKKYNDYPRHYCYLIENIDVSFSVISDPSVHLADAECFEVHVRLHYPDDTHEPPWQKIWTNTPRTGKKEALAYGQRWLASAFQRDIAEDKYDQDSGFPLKTLPVRAEFRIVHIVITNKLLAHEASRAPDNAGKSTETS